MYFWHEREREREEKKQRCTTRYQQYEQQTRTVSGWPASHLLHKDTI